MTLEQVNMPLLGDMTYWFELPNGEFIKIDLNENANGDWVVEYHDHTNEFVSGLQINPAMKISSTKQVASSTTDYRYGTPKRVIPPLTNKEEKEFAKEWSQLFPKTSKD